MSIALLQAIVQLVQVGIQVSPQIIAAGRTVLELLHKDAPPPTAEQKAQIDAALEASHQALQNAQPRE